MKPLALILVALQFVGCVYHQVTIGPRSTEDDYREATAMMENKQATVIFGNESKIKAEQLEFKLDSLIYVHLKTGEMTTAPISEMNRAISREIRPYVKNGVTYGGIAGAALGLLAATFALSIDGSCQDCSPRPQSEWAMIFPAFMVTGGVIGAGAGALIGASNAPVYSVEYHLDK
ncbi:hypothetical protein EH220_01090 [bacterium]|nr:MAG: hypothetical protein EH220_01090 [bacterium]